MSIVNTGLSEEKREFGFEMQRRLSGWAGEMR